MTKRPPLFTVLMRGFIRRCPQCGKGRLFDGYLKLAPSCSQCGTPFGAIRADDAPPYFTIVIVGHMVVPVVLYMEREVVPPLWVSMSLGLLLTAALVGLLLPRVKGATAGLMWRLGLKGDEYQ